MHPRFLSWDLLMEFRVYGKPATAGSKRAFVNRKTMRAIVVDDAKHGRPWRHAVQAAAMEHCAGKPLWNGPVALGLEFLFERPKGHFGTGANAGRVKASAPRCHTTKPDLTKLVRAVEDALTKVVWKDDSLVCWHHDRPV